MTSKETPNVAYVWIWLPDRTAPVVAGRLFRANGRIEFNYGRSYLGREDAISIYKPELPLEPGGLPPLDGQPIASCIRDAAPDAWGRRVIVNKLLGRKGANIDTDQIDELTYLLQSGSDRIGALDFQRSPTEYEPRESSGATLEELLEAADLVQRGIPLPEGLDHALLHGSSIGGARPKAMITDDQAKYIAKFSASNDVINVVKAEFVAMRLARSVGLNVANVRLQRSLGRDVILVERFDRRSAQGVWLRTPMVSALTIFGLDEMLARYASYEELCEKIRHRFAEPGKALRELFGRLVLNILVGNNDDHARNHAAFWDGDRLTLTPAYDICPQARAGNETSQAMKIIGGDGRSQLEICRKAAPNFLLSSEKADDIIVSQVETIKSDWNEVCDEAALSEVDRRAMWRRQILNPYAFENLPPHLAGLAD